jgi:hypothetical protein
VDVYPTVYFTSDHSLTTPVTLQQSGLFSELKLMKNIFCCVSGESKLNTLMTLSAEEDLACELSFDQNV